ncbi:MAG: endonuclease III [Spirochaetales bacterium]|nr:endonuclease III [Spirochaetales bacterium]
MESDQEFTERIHKIYEILVGAIPDSSPLLTFDSPYQLLIAVILSAQTTDAQVNGVTPTLFGKYPAPADLARASLDDVETIVHSVGFFHTKAKNIRAAARMLVDRYEGKVPGTMDELLVLPGVGRKSANVVLGRCFSQPAIIVDTHFGRVTRRIGLTESKDPEKVEYRLKSLVPPDMQYEFSMLINLHGRGTCNSRSPRCADCAIALYCDSQEEVS